MDYFKNDDYDEEFDVLFGNKEKESSIAKKQKIKCEHKEKIEQLGHLICLECGEEVEQKLISGRECGQEIKSADNISRCSSRRNLDKNLYKDVENKGFSDSIVSVANNIFSCCIKNRIRRDKTRESIVLACVFEAYKMEKDPQSFDSLLKHFNISRKKALEGIKFVNINLPKEYKKKTRYITPKDLIKNILENFNIRQDSIDDIHVFCDKVLSKKSSLNDSRPYSIAAGIIYYWIVANNKNITIKEYKEKVKLSESTILKIYKEIHKIVNKI